MEGVRHGHVMPPILKVFVHLGPSLVYPVKNKILTRIGRRGSDSQAVETSSSEGYQTLDQRQTRAGNQQEFALRQANTRRMEKGGRLSL